jgi:hypothetical protein
MEFEFTEIKGTSKSICSVDEFGNGVYYIRLYKPLEFGVALSQFIHDHKGKIITIFPAVTGTWGAKEDDVTPGYWILIDE